MYGRLRDSHIIGSFCSKNVIVFDCILLFLNVNVFSVRIKFPFCIFRIYKKNWFRKRRISFHDTKSIRLFLSHCQIRLLKVTRKVIEIKLCVYLRMFFKKHFIIMRAHTNKFTFSSQLGYKTCSTIHKFTVLSKNPACKHHLVNCELNFVKRH